MTPDDYLLWCAQIDELNDGSQQRAAIVVRLHQKLIDAPDDDFPTFYFETLASLRDDPMRELAERLLRSGAVHGLTRISDIPAIVADEYQSKERNDSNANGGQ
jgi:hypothetical protein